MYCYLNKIKQWIKVLLFNLNNIEVTDGFPHSSTGNTIQMVQMKDAWDIPMISANKMNSHTDHTMIISQINKYH